MERGVLLSFSYALQNSIVQCHIESRRKFTMTNNNTRDFAKHVL